MIIELIFLAILILSLVGITFILARKLPDLHSLPQTGTAGIREHKVVVTIESKVKTFLNFFEKQIFLHKFLSWVKVMAIKVETRIDETLRKIRKKAQQEKNIENRK